MIFIFSQFVTWANLEFSPFSVKYPHDSGTGCFYLYALAAFTNINSECTENYTVLMMSEFVNTVDEDKTVFVF